MSYIHVTVLVRIYTIFIGGVTICVGELCIASGNSMNIVRVQLPPRVLSETRYTVYIRIRWEYFRWRMRSNRRYWYSKVNNRCGRRAVRDVRQ